MNDQPKREENRTSERLGVRAQLLRDKAAQASKQRALLARALRANETRR